MALEPINRRSLLTTGLAFLAAPAIVRATSLMPIKAFKFLESSPFVEAAVMQKYLEDLIIYGTSSLFIDHNGYLRNMPLMDIQIETLRGA